MVFPNPPLMHLLHGRGLMVFSIVSATMASIIVGLAVGFASPILATLISPEAPHNLGIMTKATAMTFSGMSSLGASFGCIIGSFLPDKLGRRGVMLVGSPLFILAMCLIGIAPSPLWMCLARAVSGFSMGIAFTASSLYMSEIAPSKFRGSVGSLTHVSLMVGMSLAYVYGVYIFRTGESCEYCHWRVMAFWCTVPGAVLFLTMALICPESPRWLAMRGRVSEAKAVLSALRGGHVDDVELASLMSVSAKNVGEGEKAEKDEKAVLTQLLEAKKQFGLAILILVFRMLGGAHCLFYFMSKILKDAGVDEWEMYAFLVSLFGVLTALIPVFVVERFGRKIVFIISSLGLAFSFVILGLAFQFPALKMMGVVSVFTGIGFFSAGVGPLPFVISSEMLPDKIRALCYSLGSTVMWLTSFTTAVTLHPLVQAMSAQGVFWMYGGISVAIALTVHFGFPETKGKTFEEIQAIFGRNQDTEASKTGQKKLVA